MSGVAARAVGWTESGLVPDGRFFMHIFCHRTTPYEYIDKGPSDWMSRRSVVMPILEDTYGKEDAGRWWMRWRNGSMACQKFWIHGKSVRGNRNEHAS